MVTASAPRSRTFSVHHRGGSGIVLHGLTDKTGLVAGIAVVDPDNDIMIITDDGVIIRTPVEDIRQCGRSSQGVIVMRTGEDVRVISIARTDKEEADEDEAETEGRRPVSCASAPAKIILPGQPPETGAAVFFLPAQRAPACFLSGRFWVFYTNFSKCNQRKLLSAQKKGAIISYNEPRSASPAHPFCRPQEGKPHAIL